jgi:hypothetical protein
MRADTVKGYAEKAGFGTFEVLPIENDFFRLPAHPLGGSGNGLDESRGRPSAPQVAPGPLAHAAGTKAGWFPRGEYVD